MAALTRTVAEWLTVNMAAASVPRYADAQFSSGWRGGIYIHAGSGKYALATDSISTSESIRLSGKLTVTARDWLNVGMSAASVSRYADAQSGVGWRKVGIFVHDSPTAKSRFAWEYLRTSESTSTGPPIRLSATESLMVFMSAASVSRYAVAQSGAGWRGGIYIHGPEPVLGESLHATEVVVRSLVLARSCSESISIAEAVTVFKPPTARTATDALNISENATATRTIVRFAADSLTAGLSAVVTATKTRSSTDALTLSDVVTRMGGFRRSPVDFLSTSEVATFTSTGFVTAFAQDHLVISEVVTRIFSGARTAVDALTLAEIASRFVGESRSCTDSLTISEVVTFTRTGLVTATAQDHLVIAELVSFTQTRQVFAFAQDHLVISELATWFSNEFTYLLPFPTGNYPVETLHQCQKTS